MSFFGELWDNTAGGLVWKPLKKATGLSDAQLALLAAGVVTGGAALAAAPAAGAAGAGAAAAGAGAAEAGAASAGLLGAESAGAAGTVIGGSGAPITAQAGAEMATSLNAAGYGGASQGGFMEAMKTASGYAKPAMQAMQAGSMAKGLLAPQQQAPVAQAQPRPLQLDAGLLSSNSQGITDEATRRRQQINQFAQNAMGGGYGRTA